MVTGTRVGSFNAPACIRHLIGTGLFGEPLPLHTVRSQPRTSPSVRRCKKSPEPQAGLVMSSAFDGAPPGVVGRWGGMIAFVEDDRFV